MYYVNLPWYAQIIWIIGVAIVLLPVVASVTIVVTVIAQRIAAIHKEATGLQLSGNLSSGRLGVTMADGGDPIKADSDKRNK